MSSLDLQRPKAPSRTYWTQLKQEIEAPDSEEERERPATPVNLTPFPPEEVSYEDQIDKYGWLAEVHGDPLNLKSVPKTSYTVKALSAHCNFILCDSTWLI